MKYTTFLAVMLLSTFIFANNPITEPPFVLKIQHELLKKGSEHVLEFKAANTKSLIGYQFAIELSEELEFVEVITGDIPDLTKNNFGLQKSVDGMVFTNWFSANQRVFVENELIFSFKVNVKKDVDVADAVIINHAKMASEVYKVDGQHFDIELIFSQESNTESNEMLVFPNPAKDEISVQSSIAPDHAIELLSPAGTILNSYKPKSYILNINKIDISNIPSGVYLIRWKDADGSLNTQKILKL